MYLGAHPDVQLGTEEQPVLAGPVADWVARQFALAGEKHDSLWVKFEEEASLHGIQKGLRR
jgi:hypothetical protein